MRRQQQQDQESQQQQEEEGRLGNNTWRALLTNEWLQTDSRGKAAVGVGAIAPQQGQGASAHLRWLLLLLLLLRGSRLYFYNTVTRQAVPKAASKALTTASCQL
jgi:hypothetical protein